MKGAGQFFGACPVHVQCIELRLSFSSGAEFQMKFAALDQRRAFSGIRHDGEGRFGEGLSARMRIRGNDKKHAAGILQSFFRIQTSCCNTGGNGAFLYF